MKNFLKSILKIIIIILVKVYCKIVYRYKVEGKENIPEEGSLIFCGNHKSYLDPVLIEITSTRNLRFMAKEELKKNFIFGILCECFDVIYVKRNEKDIGPLKEALKTLKNGGCIGIFPEGTRNGMEKNDGKLKDGASYLALKTGAKIIPIGIIGDAKIFRKNIIRFGKPIEIEDYQTKDKSKENENKELVTNILKEEIIKLTK